MKSLTIALLMLGVLLAHPSIATPQVMSAGDLRQLCADADHVSVNVCRVYILGVAQGIALGLNIADGKTKGGRPCVPDSATAEHLEALLKSKLDASLASHPAKSDLDAAAVLGALLVSTYPCPNPNP